MAESLAAASTTVHHTAASTAVYHHPSAVMYHHPSAAASTVHSRATYSQRAVVLECRAPGYGRVLTYIAASIFFFCRALSPIAVTISYVVVWPRHTAVVVTSSQLDPSRRILSYSDRHSA